VIGYDALFGKSRMSYIRSFFLTVYTAVVVCTSDTVQFSSNPVCRMSYGVVSTSNTVCRTSYLYCVEFICHMRYYICSWIRTYLCCMFPRDSVRFVFGPFIRIRIFVWLKCTNNEHEYEYFYVRSTYVVYVVVLVTYVARMDCTVLCTVYLYHILGTIYITHYALRIMQYAQ